MNQRTFTSNIFRNTYKYSSNLINRYRTIKSYNCWRLKENSENRTSKVQENNMETSAIKEELTGPSGTAGGTWGGKM